MFRYLGKLVFGGVMLFCVPGISSAETTGWLNQEDFKLAAYRLTEQWLVPVDIAVRINDGEPQFSARWAKNTGQPFGFAIYPLLARADAEEAVATHIDPGPGILDELCLVKFAHASEGDAEGWLVYLTEEDIAGYRCIRLPD